jgi:hypothetical protein
MFEVTNGFAALHRLASNNIAIICSTAEGVRFVSDSEVLTMFLTVDCEGTARNISEAHKKLYSGDT